ncbi:MAG: hypothetical protein HQK81_15640 [Desulfovibrionaceae bacterium]|nr:hypothetical protein [Desulfovibrionaceae bacterium]
MCACYDMFGVAESPQYTTKRTRNIKFVGHGTEIIAATGEEGFNDTRAGLIRNWAAMLKRKRVSVALGAIHQFNRPGLDKYWQRHGIAVASAALGGGVAIGAAHFVEQLPAPGKSTLAAAGVPRSHLREGLHRRHHAIEPVKSVLVGTSHGDALIRVFAA